MMRTSLHWKHTIHFRLCLAFFLAAAGAASAADDWPQFLGPTRNGVYAGPQLARQFPAGGPPVVWVRDVGEGFSGPVVSGGKLILFHRIAGEEIVEALDATSGKTLWKATQPTRYRDDFGFGDGPRSTPAIAGGKVFAYGADGNLQCLELATGKRLWNVATHTDFKVKKGFFGAACSPLVIGERVVLNLGGSHTAGVVAFNIADGSVAWKSTTDEASYASPVLATFGDTRLLLAFTRAGLVALDPATGAESYRLKWRARMDASVNAATPLVNGNQVFISTEYGVGAILLQWRGGTFEKVWSNDESLTNHYNTAVYRDGYLYGLHGRQEAGPELRCIELKTGAVRWSQRDFRAASLILAGDLLVALRDDGKLVLVEATPDKFHSLGEAAVLTGEVRAHPALVAGQLYARDAKQLKCLNLRGQ